ncbi:MAG: sensor histidine kinase [Beutenbergiaceae bacterium]
MERPRWRERWLRRTRWSVRTRVLTALVALSALALLATGATAYVLERGRLDEGIDDSLRRAESEFRTLAQGVDPATGLPFVDVERLLRFTMGSTVPAAHEGMLGFVDGEVALYAAAEYPVQLQRDAELVQSLIPLTLDGAAGLSTVVTGTSSYRVLVVAVQAGLQSGALVLAYDRFALHRELSSTYRTYAAVALGALLLIGLIGFAIVSDLLAPIRLLRTEASQISSAHLDRRVPVVGNDDLAALTVTLNTMLDRLQGAFDSQRELLDDVGHELRTPLTVVRGHLELMDPTDAGDAAAAQVVALDELDRMNDLVEELVTLARARRPDFVQRQQTDVAVLTDEIATKASTLGDRSWQLDNLAEASAQLDPRRVTQAWLQLASNAVKFSEPGSVIGIGSEVDGGSDGAGTVRLWVRDQGVGIDAADQQRIFDRFSRVAGSGVEGSGLGLTIVRSIVLAHGGRVEVDSTPGEGTQVTMVLPRTVAPNQPQARRDV